MVYGTITVDYSELEDNILIKSDGMPTYNFANVVDDHLMNITHVIRGTEYLSSTPKYNLMYDAFGWERPTYIHLPPIMKDAQHKLSKRNGDASYEDFVNKGYVKEAIINYIALLGWSPKTNQEKMTLEELTKSFGLDGISKSPSIFDEAKMKWLSGEYIKAMTDEEFVKRADEFLKKSKVYGKYDALKIAKLLKTRIEIFSEIPEKINFLEEFGEYDLEMYTHKKMKTNLDIAKIVLPKAREVIANLPEFTFESLHDSLMALVAELGMKNGQVLWCVRIAISAKESTPGGVMEIAELLGKEETLRRLDFSINLINK
jgi:glutamyl-tRNA synthetase